MGGGDVPGVNCIVVRGFISERGVANGIIFAGVGVGQTYSPADRVFSFSLRLESLLLASAGLGLIAGGIWYVIARDTPGACVGFFNEAKLIEAGLPKQIPFIDRCKTQLGRDSQESRCAAIISATFVTDTQPIFS